LFYNKFISCLYMFRAYVLIIRRSKLHYTASGIITLIGGRLVHRLRDSLLNLCTVILYTHISFYNFSCRYMLCVLKIYDF